MQCAARDHYCRAVGDGVLDAIEHRFPLPFFNADKLIELMHFLSDVLPRQKTHHDQLQIRIGKQHFAKILVRECTFFDVCYISFHARSIPNGNNDVGRSVETQYYGRVSHIIRNFEELATIKEREDALAIAEAGYENVNTENAILRKMRIENEELVVEDRRYPLAGRRVFFVGIGKCAIVAGRTIEQLLGERLTAGVALDVSAMEGGLTKIETYIGTHPEPSDVNRRATERIVGFLSQCREDDLVLMLISGGGSALLCLHDAPMTCLDERTLFDELTSHGASIQELNTVRKHISKARGGGLAKAAYPAEVIGLIISDVPGDNFQYIASGPTTQDDSTVADARAVLAHYEIQPPAGVAFIETPKESKYFERVTNLLLVTGRDALDAMRAEAARLGYAATVVDEHFADAARDIGRSVAAKLHDAPSRSAFLYAGESTVTLGEEHGKGGRNQEMALATLDDVRVDEIILPFASDGHDNSDHAGAIADQVTREHAEQRNLSISEHLSAHTSYDFFTTTGDFLNTGHTGSNVSDLIIAIKT